MEGKSRIEVGHALSQTTSSLFTVKLPPLPLCLLRIYISAPHPRNKTHNSAPHSRNEIHSPPPHPRNETRSSSSSLQLCLAFPTMDVGKHHSGSQPSTHIRRPPPTPTGTPALRHTVHSPSMVSRSCRDTSGKI